MAPTRAEAPPTAEGRSAAAVTPLAQRLGDRIYAESLDCVHCGLCLTSCPTYRATGRETSSPRGRIYLMRGMAEGRLDDVALLDEEASLCLGCRACETACPSGVRYGEMLEQTRAALSETRARPGWAHRLERLALRHVVPHRRRLRALIALLAVAQRTGIDRLVTRLGPRRLREARTLLPAIPPAPERRRLPVSTPAQGRRRGRVALLEGCVMPELFGRVNDAARRVLARAGWEVVVPEAQGCCGALQAHSGDLETARSLARHNVHAFAPELPGVDAVVVTSAGCSAALRESEGWIGAEARPLAGGVRDVLEFLDEVGLGLELAPIPRRVCYDDPCHLVHAQGISAAPRRLLESIPELDLVAHRDAQACCGAAGIYNLMQPEMSGRVLAPKLDAILEVAPEIVATANPGCAMQLASGLAGRGSGVPVMHPIELLERATRPD